MSNASLNINDSHNILGTNKKTNAPWSIDTNCRHITDTSCASWQRCNAALIFSERLKIDCSTVTKGVHCCYQQKHTQADTNNTIPLSSH